MRETSSIVVPVDFSEITSKLVDYAINMASRFSGVIHFVHVVHFYAGDTMLGFSYSQECEAKLIKAPDERMANLLAKNKERCPLSRTVSDSF